MPKLYSSAMVEQVLEQHEFYFISQRGSHKKFRKRLPGGKGLTVILPAGRREIPRGTFRSILRQAQLGERDFN